MNFLPIMNEQQARNLNPLVLAYIGDAVHSLIVKEKLVHNHDCKANALHQMASSQVNAHNQAEIANVVLPLLNQDEMDIYKRGRNSKNNHTAKNQSRDDYKHATGIEAVFGYLYLTGQSQRILQLLEVSNEDRG